MDRILGLKIDVDTHQGMKRGVPRLLDLLAREGLQATFYLSIGPDASGLAIFQLLRNPRFLRKMVATRAPSLYGYRTALYGTLLPSPMIALAFPDLVRRILAEGHEVQFHAWDHRRWQDGLLSRSPDWIRRWFDRGVAGFKSLTGQDPTSFGAPAWLIDERVLSLAKEYPFQYLSCTRAGGPFIHAANGLPEIPSDLPCFEETGCDLGEGPILQRLEEGNLHVLPLHAEVEGGMMAEPFLRLIRKARERGYRPRPLAAILPLLERERLEVRQHQLVLLPGRAVPCAV